MTGSAESTAGIELLVAARRAEKEQALAYRGLAALAENAGDVDLAQRFHDLHADEQHHLSRITARLLELRQQPADLLDVRSAAIPLEGWAEQVTARERIEIDRYRGLLRQALDPATRALIEEILAVEEHHAAELGGKWTIA